MHKVLVIMKYICNLQPYMFSTKSSVHLWYRIVECYEITMSSIGYMLVLEFHQDIPLYHAMLQIHIMMDNKYNTSRLHL